MKKKLKFKKKRGGNKAFALVELVVAVGLFAIVVVPIMASMVTSLRLNLKSRKQMAATEVAQNVLEGIRGKTYKEVANELSSVNSGSNSLTIIDGGAYNTANNGIQISTCSGNDLDLISFTSPTSAPENMSIGAISCKTSDLVASGNRAYSYAMNQIYAGVAKQCLDPALCAGYGVDAVTELGATDIDPTYGRKALIACGEVAHVASHDNEGMGFMCLTNIDRAKYHFDVVVQFVPMFKEGVTPAADAINQKYYTYQVYAYVYELTPEMVGQPNRMTGDPLCTMMTCIRNK